MKSLMVLATKVGKLEILYYAVDTLVRRTWDTINTSFWQDTTIF